MLCIQHIAEIVLDMGRVPGIQNPVSFHIRRQHKCHGQGKFILIQPHTSFSGGQIPKSIGRLLVPVYAIANGHQTVHQRRASCDAVGIGGALTSHPAEEIRQGGIGCG